MALKESSYAKQVALLVDRHDYLRAYEVASECITTYPEYLVGFLLHARAALFAGKLSEAEKSARYVFNRAQGADLEPASILLLLVLFAKKEYGQAIHIYELLKAKKLVSSKELDLLYGLLLSAQGDVEKGKKLLAQLDSEYVGPILAQILTSQWQP